MMEYVDANTIRAQISLLPSTNTKSILLVEGSSDNLFYKQFIDRNLCHSLPANGKKNILELIPKLTRYPGLIGIIDADYSVINNQQCPDNKIFRTDTHDLETLLIRSRALEKVLIEYGDEKKIQKFEEDLGKSIRNVLIDNAKYIGYFVWLNNRSRFNLKFNGLDFKKIFDWNTLEIDLNNLIIQVHNNSNRKNDKTHFFLKEFGELKGSGDKYDPWHLCRGHDLVEILLIGLQKKFGSRSGRLLQNSTELEKYLRMAFEKEFFQQTDLYTSITNWETLHSPYVVLLK